MQPSLHGSRLVALLAEFTPQNIEAASHDFADRLGQLVGLSGSITLSRMHEELAAAAFKPTDLPTEAIVQGVKEAFLRDRKDLVRIIATRFVPKTGRHRDKLPTSKKLHSHFQSIRGIAPKRTGNAGFHSAAFEPYRTFYMARQRELEMRIARLQAYIRDAISGLSPELTRLAKLDAALDQVLSQRAQTLFGRVSRFLEARFGGLLDGHWEALPGEPEVSDVTQWMQPGGWIHQFCAEMRDLLLAELDVRLQPVLGMVESLPGGSDPDQ